MTSPAAARTLCSVSSILAPTERDERIGMLDATRGIAVLGILLMNITGFGLPQSYDDPTNWGGHEGLNLTTWRIAALFFEGVNPLMCTEAKMSEPTCEYAFHSSGVLKPIAFVPLSWT